MDGDRWLSLSGFRALLTDLVGARGEDAEIILAQLLDDRGALITEIDAAHKLLDWMAAPRAYTTGEVLSLSARIGRAIELAQRGYDVD